MPENEETVELLQILSTEIARDGGASLVGSLKDYVSRPKRIEALVKKSIGSTKLLTFLEQHPTIFDVDRDMVPHFVKLLSDDYCQGYAPSSAEHEREALRDKVYYVFRRRSAKRARRRQSDADQKDSNHDHEEIHLTLLSKECTTQLHCYLRALGLYPQIYSSYNHVQMVGSPKWHDMVQPEFQSFLQNIAILADGKVWLQGDEQEQDVQQFSDRLTALVDQDGGTQVSLSLLLHRKTDLKALLGGRDFLTLVKDHEDYFSNLIITQYGSDVELQSTKPKGNGRMEVDETGLFSVASSKWGTAMASGMVWACPYCSLPLDPRQVTAIDLTASVGGHALALARTPFSRVIAIEIDSHRAELCRQNMLKHGMEEVVDVRNADAMELIPELAIELSNRQSVVVIDPPWGGIHYKQEKKPICLGPWALEEVVERVAQHLSPTIVGLRLPVNFVVRDFVDVLRERGLSFETLNIRKLGPQLFVILAFGTQSSLC